MEGSRRDSIRHVSRHRTPEDQSTSAESEASDVPASEAAEEVRSVHHTVPDVRRPIGQQQAGRRQELGRGNTLGRELGITPAENVEPMLRRGRSGPSRVQPVMHGSIQGEAPEVVFTGAESLFQEGLDQWKDRSLSLQCLRRNGGRVRSTGYPGASSRRSQDSSEGTDATTPSAVHYRTGEYERDGDNNHSLERSEEGLHLKTFGHRSPAAAAVEEETTMDMSRELYSCLAEAPQASLIHVVGLYHQVLLNHGLEKEAEKIASVIRELQDGIEFAEMARELQGMDLLLKDGLLKYLLMVTPYLPPIPSQVVRFKGITYSSKVTADTGYETMYTKLMGLIKRPLAKPTLQDAILLKDVSGYLMPGTLTLVVGPPGCGKSTLHKVIAGMQVPPGSHLDGTVTYNGNKVHDILINRLAAVVDPRDVHLAPLTVRETLEFARECSQALTAKDLGQELQEVMGEALKFGQDPKLELTISMMGLKKVAGRPVGSPMRPSLTEDERHRLTTAEMIAGTYAVYLFDQLNTGVEDAATFDLVSSVRIFSRVRQTAVMASLVEPSPEVFELFDRLILLDGGQVMFQGPRQDALPYFESLGYVKPRHLTVSEFLAEVTTPGGSRFLQPGYPQLVHEDFVASYLLSPTFRDIRRVVNNVDLVQELWVQGNRPLGLGFTESRPNNGNGIAKKISTLVAAVVEKGGSLAEVSMDQTTGVAPGDEVVAVGGAGEMLKYFNTNDRALDRSLTGGLAMAIEQVAEPVRLQLERPFREVVGTHGRQFERNYILDLKPEFLLLLKREIRVMWRNKLSLALRMTQILILSIFTGVVFFRVQNDPNQLDMNLLRGVFFVSLMNLTLINLGQLPTLMEERAVYYKQQNARFFRPQSYLLAKIFGGLPFTIMEATTWSLIVYFMTGLSLTDGGWHFWVYYVVAILTDLNGASLVRFMSAFASDREVANGIIGILVAIFILFAGFLVPRFKVPHYWIWAYYLDPLQWGITALVINEFNSKSYSMLCSQVPNLASIPQCVGRPQNTVGHAFLAKGQFYTSNHWIGIAVMVLIGWFILFNIGAYLSLARLRHLPKRKLSPPMEVKLHSEGLNHQKDEEWGRAERKLSHTAEPLTLSWHELSYDILIPTIGQTRTILNFVSGWAEPGEMVGLLGCDGAGKTTLLNCLAGRKVSLGRIGGQILVNGYPKIQKTYANAIGYVDDLHSYAPHMTVQEAITFSAAMRLGKKSPIQKRQEFVEEVLQLVEIKHLSDKLLLSLREDEVTQEQAMRLAIATELAGNPSIMFLDEPTKGLDSHASSHIIRCLKHIADTGRVVITTLRQPSLRQLVAFNSLLILKRGGETVYFGQSGINAELVQKYFEAIPGTPLCPPNKSPTSYAIDVIGDGITDRKALRDYAFEYRVSELALHNHVQLQHLRRSKGQNGPELTEAGYRAPYSLMAYEIFIKMQRFYWRNVGYSFSRMTSSLALGLILGSVYFNVNIHTTVGMTVKSQSLFIVCVLLGITNAQSVVPSILLQKATLEREQSTNQYNVLFYNLAWTFAEVPYLALATMIFCFVFCLMAQMAVHSAADFFRFYFVLFEFSLAITFLGIFIAAISPSPQIVAVLIPLTISFWTSTGGSVIPKRKILKTVIWIFWTNPIQYALNSLTSIAFFCDTNTPQCLDVGQNTACLHNPSACPQCSCPRLHDANNVFVWTQLQMNRSLNHHRIPIDILVLAMYCLLFRVMTAAAIRVHKWRRIYVATH